MTILERVARSAAFTPATVEAYFALQLAKRLGDEANIPWYLRLLEQNTMERLTSALLQVHAGPKDDHAERFRKLLS